MKFKMDTKKSLLFQRDNLFHDQYYYYAHMISENQEWSGYFELQVNGYWQSYDNDIILDNIYRERKLALSEEGNAIMFEIEENEKDEGIIVENVDTAGGREEENTPVLNMTAVGNLEDALNCIEKNNPSVFEMILSHGYKVQLDSAQKVNGTVVPVLACTNYKEIMSLSPEDRAVRRVNNFLQKTRKL